MSDVIVQSEVAADTMMVAFYSFIEIDSVGGKRLGFVPNEDKSLDVKDETDTVICSVDPSGNVTGDAEKVIRLIAGIAAIWREQQPNGLDTTRAQE